ncbi:MAG: alcohol dehydrogenase catalytic domain-containing protein [Roseibacillus sp.]|nr:alcohol dehydrogenase catalytic domain-containing protein [Roseibacillus sp.]
MKALELISSSAFKLVEKPMPEPGPNDLLIAVRACGICGSDIHGMDGSSGRRIPPLVMGHEAAGIIERCGSNVTGWSEGDRLTFDSTIYCGECDYCRSGHVNLCEDREVLGVSTPDFRRQGAFADYVVVPSRICHRIPVEVPFEEAAFAEPVSVALHAVNRVNLAEGESAVVVGAGLIGLLVIQSLRRAGCENIIAIDLAEERLELAMELGATSAFRPDHDDLEGVIRALTGGEGPEVVVEVVGISSTVELAVNMARKGGRVCLVGNLAPSVQFPLQAAVTRELDILGSCAINGEYPDAIAAIAAGEIDVRALTSCVVPLAEGASWFARLEAGKESLLKVILRPG